MHLPSLAQRLTSERTQPRLHTITPTDSPEEPEMLRHLVLPCRMGKGTLVSTSITTIRGVTH